MDGSIVTADDYKADLWSAGAVLYELVAAKHPFGGANQVNGQWARTGGRGYCSVRLKSIQAFLARGGIEVP